MICYLATAGKTHTMTDYLESWGGDLASKISFVHYDDLPGLTKLPVGTYIFSDLERLTPTQRLVGVQVRDQLDRGGGPVQGMLLLNHPGRAMARYELLRSLYESGKNRFQVTRASELGVVRRFPVFLREESEHAGSITELLNNQEELDKALVPAVLRGHRLDDLLVVEYCDTSDEDGIFRKYSAFNVGGTIIPRHNIFSKVWQLKNIDLLDEVYLDEEKTYLETNPHEAWLRDVFEQAHIDYGRIDYSVLGGQPQTWEINTNPVVMLPRAEYDPKHIQAQEFFAPRIRAAFDAIDCPDDSGREIPINVDPKLVERLKGEKKKKSRARSRRALAKKLNNKPVFDLVRRVLRPAIKKISPLMAGISRVMRR